MVMGLLAGGRPTRKGNGQRALGGCTVEVVCDNARYRLFFCCPCVAIVGCVIYDWPRIRFLAFFTRYHNRKRQIYHDSFISSTRLDFPSLHKLTLIGIIIRHSRLTRREPCQKGLKQQFHPPLARRVEEDRGILILLCWKLGQIHVGNVKDESFEGLIGRGGFNDEYDSFEDSLYAKGRQLIHDENHGKGGSDGHVSFPSSRFVKARRYTP